MSQIPAYLTWGWIKRHVLDAPEAEVERVGEEAAAESLPDCDECPVNAMCVRCGGKMEVIGWVEEVQRCYFVCRVCDKIAWGQRAEGE